MTTGADLIAAERQRQIDVEGYTPEHDDRHVGYGADTSQHAPMRRAALCYLRADRGAHSTPGTSWPWEQRDWKPSDDPIRNLVRAGALIAAEIDRLLRATTEPCPNPSCVGGTEGGSPPPGFPPPDCGTCNGTGTVPRSP